MEFPKGIRWTNPHEKAPDFVKGKISIKSDEFIPYLQENAKNGWLNMIVKKSQKGIIYFELDTWQPTKQTTPEEAKKEIEDDGSSFEKEVFEEEEIDTKNIPF